MIKAAEGLFFEVIEGDAVKVVKKIGKGENERVLFTQVIQPDDWARVVIAMPFLKNIDRGE